MKRFSIWKRVSSKVIEYHMSLSSNPPDDGFGWKFIKSFSSSTVEAANAEYQRYLEQEHNR